MNQLLWRKKVQELQEANKTLWWIINELENKFKTIIKPLTNVSSLQLNFPPPHPLEPQYNTEVKTSRRKNKQISLININV